MNGLTPSQTSGKPDISAAQAEALRRVENWLRRERRSRTVVRSEGRIDAIEETGVGRSSYGYDRRGDLTEITEDNGRRTRYRYDERRRLAAVARGDGPVTRHVYGDDGRLAATHDRGIVHRFEYDEAGRPTRINRGGAGACVYRYDAHGRVVEARTGSVSTRHDYDERGRVVAIDQALNGTCLSLRLSYDEDGRLARLGLPGSEVPVRYLWDAKGRPRSVALGERVIASFTYLDRERRSRVRFANGVAEETTADSLDGRPLSRRVERGEEILFERRNRYDESGLLIADGARRYGYDGAGRLARAADAHGGRQYRYTYDSMDNLAAVDDGAAEVRYRYDAEDRLVEAAEGAAVLARFDHDGFGRLVRRSDATGAWTYRYDDAGHLVAALRQGQRVAQLAYDHKGRLVLARFADRSERYLYGPGDELLAVTTEDGRPLRLYVRTPLGPLAEIHGTVESGEVHFLHLDDRGNLSLATDRNGVATARYDYGPFGFPDGDGRVPPIFGGRIWCAELGLFWFGARWYCPRLARFLTPDSYTGAPDDERLLHPARPAAQQALSRAQILNDWLKRPRVRNPYAFCGNDPVNRVDPNGHWSFGGVLLSLLGALWTLPNTVFGLLIEITCLVGEVIRWLVWLVTGGNVTWKTPGFDAAASSHLNAFALVFEGGWLGSFSSLLGITFGNVFFVYKDWKTHPAVTALPPTVSPPAYGGTVTIARDDALYEHELRHTNQYGWFGPFFHLGLPIWGVYVWDVIFNGYHNAWLERDAREHAGF